MINIWIVLIIIFIHWIADFLIQTDWQAKNKSSNNSALLLHTGIYSLVWLPFSIILFGNLGYLFILITFICHTITDYFTSRLNTKLVPKRELVGNSRNTNGIECNIFAISKNESWHNFFVSVGFDQVLHYTQLLLTYYYLTK